MLLAIDTSTNYAGAALYSQAGVLAERTWRASRNHSEQMLAAIDSLMRDVGSRPADLSAVAVARGPGSWSGLRVGLSLAKGLAVARNLPLIGVDSLEVLAYPHQRVSRPVYPIIKLGRDRYAAVEYRLRRRWRPIGEARNLSLDELIARLPEVALLCGDLDERITQRVRQGRGEGIIFMPSALGLRRAGYLAEIAWARHRVQDYNDCVTLEPIYLGTPVKT